MTRGEIWWVDFGVPMESGAGDKHPAVVIQNDNYNASNIYTTAVVPITSNITLAEHPDNVLLKSEVSHLPKDSVVTAPLITAIDKNQLVEKVSKLPFSEMEKIENGVLHLFGILD